MNKHNKKYRDDNCGLIVVLGMHRSGTSLIARSLKCIGYELGDKLEPAAIGINEKGYWEDIDIVVLNEEILKFCEMSWYSTTPLSDLHLKRLADAGYVEKAIEIIRSKIDRYKKFAFKDPRTAKLILFWRRVFELGEFNVKYVVSYRNPLSVAKSLAKRDDMQILHACLMWAEHILNSLIYTADKQRHVINYDELIDNPTDVMEGLSKWSRSELVESELSEFIENFIDTNLRHAKYSQIDAEESIRIPKFIESLYSDISAYSKFHINHDSYQSTISINSHYESYINLSPVLKYVDSQFTKQIAASNKIKFLSDARSAVVLDDKKKLLDLLLDSNALSHECFNLKMQLDAETARRHSVELASNHAIHELNVAISDLKESNSEYSRALNALLMSRSWRTTAILRKFGSAYRAIRASIVGSFDIILYAPFGFAKRLVAHKARSTASEYVLKKLSDVDHWCIDKIDYIDNTLVLSGWAFSNDCDYESLEVVAHTQAGFQVCEAKYGSISPDVFENFPNFPNAKSCRFFLSCLLNSHPKTGQPIKLKFILKNGASHIIKIPYNKLAAPKEKPQFSTIEDSRSYVLFIDHGMGGGANLARDIEIKELNQANIPCILVEYHIAYGYKVSVKCNSNPVDSLEFLSLKSVINQLSAFCIDEVVVGNLVSYPDPRDAILQILDFVKQKDNVNLRVMLHDYFPLCPNWYLQDLNEKFCGVPEISKCETCMDKTQGEFLYLVPRVPVLEWRRHWYQLLARADEIRAFSNSSVELFTRAYPDLNTNLKLVPHNVPVNENKYKIPTGPNKLGRWTIASVGGVSRQKGSEFLVKIQSLIRSRGLPIDLIVVGEILNPNDKKYIKTTGKYQQNELASALATNDVAVVLLPFCWPETFSYVTHELCKLEIPLVVSNIGAPMERVSGYKNGIVTSLDVEIFLDAVLSLLKKHSNFCWSR